MLAFEFNFERQTVFKRDDWYSMRGAEMLLLMKLISLSIDIERKSVRTHEYKRIKFIDFINYLVSFDSLIFGPWTNYEDYLQSVKSRRIIWVLFSIRFY